MTAPDPQVAGGGGGGAGGASVGAAVAPSTAPLVVFGNGRTPGPAAEQPETSPLVTAPVAVPSAVGTAETPAPPPAPAPTMVQRTKTPLLTPPEAAARVTSLWGLAGLVLAPLAGIALGYRQARAHKAVAELKSTLSG